MKDLLDAGLQVIHVLGVDGKGGGSVHRQVLGGHMEEPVSVFPVKQDPGPSIFVDAVPALDLHAEKAVLRTENQKVALALLPFPACIFPPAEGVKYVEFIAELGSAGLKKFVFRLNLPHLEQTGRMHDSHTLFLPITGELMLALAVEIAAQIGPVQIFVEVLAGDLV